MDTCICMAESLRWSPKNTTLLIGYTTVQNKKSKVTNQNKKRKDTRANDIQLLGRIWI